MTYEELLKNCNEIIVDQLLKNAANAFDLDFGQINETLIELERRIAKQDQETVYLRDLDGTGSMHVCNKVDEGAVPYLLV